MIGLAGSVVGTALGLAVSYYLQAKGVNIGGMLQNAPIMIERTVRARVTPVSYVLGFLPGLGRDPSRDGLLGHRHLPAADGPAGQGVGRMKTKDAAGTVRSSCR